MLVMGFAIAVLAPLLLNGWASRHDFKRYIHPFGVAGMLATFWIANRLIDIPLDFPESRVLNIVFEFIGGCVCFWLWERHRKTWYVAMAGCFMVLSAIHAYYLPGWFVQEWFFKPTLAEAINYTYRANVAWCITLVVCSLPGGGHALRHLRDWFLLGSHSHPVPGRMA